MIYVALLIAASLILGLLILLLNEIGRQSKPKPKRISNYKPVKKAYKTRLVEPSSLQDRARLRAQSQRTGRKLSSSTETLSKPVKPKPEPKPVSPPPPVVVQPEPQPVSPTPPVVVQPEPQPEPKPFASPQPVMEGMGAKSVLTPELEWDQEPEPQPQPEEKVLEIPDYFIPSKPTKKERKRRKPTQFYPRLVSLLNGDEKGADRLVQNLLDAYPDKSERWCYEKAMFDLTRDRN